MDFDLSDEQRMLQDSVQRLLAERCSFEQRQALLGDPAGAGKTLWRQFAELGLLGLPFSEEDGGFGGGAVDTFIVMQTLGRALAPVPYLATVVLCGGLLRAAASPAQRAELVPAIAAGELTLAFAHSEAQARYDLTNVQTTARRQGNAWVLDGEKRFVLNGDTADRLIVSARVAPAGTGEDAIALFLVDANAPGLTRRGYATQDRGRSADVQLKSVQVGEEALIGKPGNALPAIEQAVDGAIAALCAEAVGAMTYAHELTVDYMKVRKQFGVAIASFQALQHRAVDMLVATEQARSMALYATMMCTEPDATERRCAISAAKVQVNNSGRFVGQEAVQLHGGIGMTEECQVGHYLRRLTMIEMMFGDTAHHVRQLARSGGLIAA
ncbi:acyl-CoA dehydrogenase family protein [Ramlibacter sp. WS9]|uniref:acyl-CoA dehydrogenase family protein n=1 Tax=Ramlibacter sp. WS9 TaxID=1882741 RepID=UPI001142BCD0|nr:acyl-CoA dehydrogenase family protein [Ramlibacter sp. WS9]ROZ69227.1 pimeloyl-CoA dehydrogenase small subunit [Ramlibacter sp. WS9]